jgi:hypothetical protein
MPNKFALAAILAMIACAGSASAAVVAGPTIGGLATFRDTNTGRDWLRLNDFFGESADQMLAVATAAGFTFASHADVQALTDTLPLDGAIATWSGYASVMGSAPSRGLMWGAYSGASGLVGWGYAYSTDFGWSLADNVDSSSDIPNNGSAYSDLNLWAYTSGAVPEPAAWTMILAGFGGLGLAARSRRRTAAV